MVHSPQRARPRARFSEPHHRNGQPAWAKKARASLPAHPPRKWGGNPAGRSRDTQPQDAWESDDDIYVDRGAGHDSESDDGWSSGTEWSDGSPPVQPMHSEPSPATAQAVSAVRAFKHTNLLTASSPIEFDARAAAALEASKKLLRFVAETAPAHFTSQLEKLETLERKYVAALEGEKDKLVGAVSQDKAKQVKALLDRLADLQRQEAANRASTLEDVRAIHKETEAALITASKKHDESAAGLHNELRKVFHADEDEGGSKSTGKGKAKKVPAKRKR